MRIGSVRDATGRVEIAVMECGIFELRQYTTRTSRREELIAIFEEQLLASQNSLGAHIIGTFRDLDDADRFVWIRGFRDMLSRQEALTAFYEGPVWQAHRNAANATMLDSGNVLLLRPIAPRPGLRDAVTQDGGANRIISAMIHYLGDVAETQFARFFEDTMLPRLIALGATPIGCLATDSLVNNYPRLPIRRHEQSFIWFARWTDPAAEEAFVARFGALSGWRDAAPETILPALLRKPERLRLAPTKRSQLR